MKSTLSVLLLLALFGLILAKSVREYADEAEDGAKEEITGATEQDDADDEEAVEESKKHVKRQKNPEVTPKQDGKKHSGSGEGIQSFVRIPVDLVEGGLGLVSSFTNGMKSALGDK